MFFGLESGRLVRGSAAMAGMDLAKMPPQSGSWIYSPTLDRGAAAIIAEALSGRHGQLPRILCHVAIKTDPKIVYTSNMGPLSCQAACILAG